MGKKDPAWGPRDAWGRYRRIKAYEGMQLQLEWKGVQPASLQRKKLQLLPTASDSTPIHGIRGE